MRHFHYIARNSLGRVVRGELHAASPTQLRSRLNAMQLQLVSLTENSANSSISRWLPAFDPRRWLPIRGRDVELTIRQLSIMLRSGTKLLTALETLHEQSQRKRLATILGQVHASVLRGESLSQALASHSVFPSIVVQLVAVGEQTGHLDQVLEQAAEHLAQRRSTLSEVRMALAYPAVVSLAAIVISAYLILAVIPELQKFLSAMGRKLPAMTQSLVDTAQWLRIHGSSLAMSLIILVGCLILLWRSPKGRHWFDRHVLKLPILGQVLTMAGTTSASSSILIMLRNGIRLVEALTIASKLQGNRYLAGILTEASRSILRGHSLAPSLAVRGGFAPILASMVDVAERSGQIDQTLSEVTKFCEAELRGGVKRMSRMVEPLVIVIAGGIVGYVYIAFFMALMSAGGNFR